MCFISPAATNKVSNRTYILGYFFISVDQKILQHLDTYSVTSVSCNFRIAFPSLNLWRGFILTLFEDIFILFELIPFYEVICRCFSTSFWHFKYPRLSFLGCANLKNMTWIFTRRNIFWRECRIRREESKAKRYGALSKVEGRV